MYNQHLPQHFYGNNGLKGGGGLNKNTKNFPRGKGLFNSKYKELDPRLKNVLETDEKDYREYAAKLEESKKAAASRPAKRR